MSANAKPLQIDGLVEIEDDRNREQGDRDTRRDIQRLEDENRQLRRDLEDVTTEKDRLTRTLKNFQTTFNPMYRAFRALFGELDLAVGEEVPAASGTGAASQSDPRWDSYKKQFGGAPALVIDALLIHGTMKRTSLAALLKRDYGTIKNAINKLRAAGAIQENPDGVSLKR